jgi:hypothetical protein
MSESTRGPREGQIVHVATEGWNGPCRVTEVRVRDDGGSSYTLVPMELSDPEVAG